MMFMLWHVFMNSEDLYSDPYSSTMMSENFLAWFLNVVTRNLSMSRGVRLPPDVNPKGCEYAEHIATKVEVNPHMLSTLKNKKFHLKHKTRGKFWDINGWTSGYFSCLGKEKNSKGIFQVREIFCDTPHESLSYHFFSLTIETVPNIWLIIREICFLIGHRQLGPQHSCFFEVWLWLFLFEDSLNYFESGGVISNNKLEGQQGHTFQEVQM